MKGLQSAGQDTGKSLGKGQIAYTYGKTPQAFQRASELLRTKERILVIKLSSDKGLTLPVRDFFKTLTTPGIQLDVPERSHLRNAEMGV